MIYTADLYCGAGGASAGLHQACHALKLNYTLTAINHWKVAIATHSQNFPGHTHLCADVEKVKPREAVPGGYLDLLLAGPSCVHFSQARGGKPVSDQQRSSAWEIIHYCRDLDVRNVLVENVPEFLTWGPTKDGRPDPLHKGHYFRQWVRRLEELGYTVEWRILNAAHFGDATTRRRLFIQARKGRSVVWPKPSHHAPAELSAYPGAKPWRPAREIIDWRLKGESIYGRKRPLAANTLKRIFAGLRKYCGLPFLVPNFGEREAQEPRTHSIEHPLPTVTSHGAGCLVEPFLVVLRRGMDAQSLDSPVPTICAGAGHLALCEPYLAKFYGGHDSASLDNPLGTICANYQHFGLCEPYLVKITQSGSWGPGIYPASLPVPTITTKQEHAVVEPYLIRYNGGDNRHQDCDTPLSTIDTSNRFGVAQPFLVSYYSHGDAHSISEPLDTVTARDRFALVSPEFKEFVDKGEVIGFLDIRFRMLQPHELAAAHSFPSSYQFSGGREDQVKQVGNSWPVGLATALCEAILS